jgi:plasmid maintenance system antidote protein VapI
MQITENHIRYATGRQLAQLIGTSENNVSQWVSGRKAMSEGMLIRAATLHGISKAVLINGIDARRRDSDLARQIQAEVDSFLCQTAAGVTA